MSGKSAKIVVTERQLEIVREIANSTTSTVRHAQRAAIILMAFRKMLSRDIAIEVGLDRAQVGMWRRRWKESAEALQAIECRESRAALTRAIEQVLSDAPRSGAPHTYTAQEVTQILAVACELPEKSGRPITRWTHRELRDEVIQRGIVASISVSQVGAYLREADRPRRGKVLQRDAPSCTTVVAEAATTVVVPHRPQRLAVMEAPSESSRERSLPHLEPAGRS